MALNAESIEAPSYRVHLPIFQGPVELLLTLIEDQQLEITAISMATVADQYLNYIRSLPERDPAELASFIEIAARLLLIKSRVLLPLLEPEEEEEDPAEALIERLEQYRRYRTSARWLEQRLDDKMRSYGSQPSKNGATTFVFRNCIPALLVQHINRIGREQQETNAPDGMISAPSISLRDKLKQVLRRVWGGAKVLFSDLLSGVTSRTDIVVTFLAVLELSRRHRVTAVQESLFGPIQISKATVRRNVSNAEDETTPELAQS